MKLNDDAQRLRKPFYRKEKPEEGKEPTEQQRPEKQSRQSSGSRKQQ